MIKCFMFDLDGTLLNTLESIRYNVNYILQKHGIEPISSEDCRKFVGGGAKKLMSLTLDKRAVFDEERREKIFLEFFDYYNAHSDYLAQPYSGIRELISELISRGLVLAVVSNKPQRAAELAVEKFFPNSFKAVSGGRDGVPLKPDPTEPLSVLKKLGISPNECVYIGDSEVDMMTGKNMGAEKTVGVSWGFRDTNVLYKSGADIVVSRPDEIIEAVAL